MEMPLTDAAIDLTIAVHALEHIADAEELMRELWRVTAPNGRLIIVVPRRRGIWAQRDNTPFGTGNPYSAGQLERLLRDHSFVPEGWRDGLFLPPFQSSIVGRYLLLPEEARPWTQRGTSSSTCTRLRCRA